MLLVGRSWEGEYRFGFQSQELDNESSGAGNTYSFIFRVYNSLICRFLSVDPLSKKYPHNSPYNFSENRVIDCGELEGLEIFYAADGTLIGKFGSSTEVRRVDDENVEQFKTELAKAIHSRDEYNRIRSNIDNNKYSVGLDNAKKIMYQHGVVATQFKNELIDKLSSSTGMNEDELNMRATLTVIRQAEKHSDVPEAYNRDEVGTVFTNSSDEDIYGNIDDAGYDSHPGTSNNDAAGAYQTQLRTWNLYKSQLGDDQSFTPANQDRMAIIIMREQVKYNPDNANLLNLVYSGNIQQALQLLNGTWPSLPGGSQEGINADEADTYFKDAIKNEINGNSKIAIPQGSL